MRFANEQRAQEAPQVAIAILRFYAERKLDELQDFDKNQLKHQPSIALRATEQHSSKRLCDKWLCAIS